MPDQTIKPLDETTAASPDIVAENIARLRELFPECFTEGSDDDGPRFKVDIEALKETLGDYAEDKEERYSFSWNGKARARRIAQTPSTGTLRPCPDESVNWDTTQNLFIEGDNLEVLKLLQKSYHRRVKLIYIDPPYNTGKEFIYPDKFQDNLDTYLRYTGQIDDEGFKLSSNSESSGRYHTNWLNMMYPRLRLARNLLADDGLMFVSISDIELHNVRKLCDEIFGEENFVECYIWNSTFRPDNSSRVYRKNAEYVLAYARSLLHIDELHGETIERTGLPSLTKSSMKPGTLTFPKGSVEFQIPDGEYAAGSKGTYELLDDVVVHEGTNAEPFSLLGPMIWRQDNLERELGSGTRLIIKTDTFVPYTSKGDEGKLRPSKLIPSDKVGDVLEANAEVRALFGANVFDYPKPSSLIKHLLAMRPDADLVLDFFAGSASTAHAVMAANQENGANRRFIMVQLPEPIPDDQDAALEYCKSKNLQPTISDLAKERIRLVAAKGKDPALGAAEQDSGFRVYKLDSSNIASWDADFDTVEQSVIEAAQNVKTDRSEYDVLYEVLLKYGLDLCVPIHEHQICKRQVFSVGAGALVACLDDAITLDVVEGIAHLKEKLQPEVMRVVFRDSGFKDDVVKSNAVQILKQAGLSDEHIRSI